MRQRQNWRDKHVGVAPSALSSYHARVSHVDDRVPPLRHAELGLAAERLRDALNRDPSIRWAYLFGSAARGEPFRDLDIGIVLKDTDARGAVRFGALIAALESAVPEFPLDVVELTSASPRSALRQCSRGASWSIAIRMLEKTGRRRSRLPGSISRHGSRAGKRCGSNLCVERPASTSPQRR